IQDHKYFTGGFVESAANRVAFSATFLRNELNVAIATLRDRAFNLFSRAVGRVALHKNDFRVLAKFGNTLHRRLYVSALVTAGNDDCAGERFLHHDGPRACNNHAQQCHKAKRWSIYENPSTKTCERRQVNRNQPNGSAT